ncbi:MAG: hypothetical protein FWG66_14145 [Spirochaetes bacterium]|nr:hypothetical protein [Spirochaetota bacterium]
MEETFEERKQAALSAAAALGIVDVTADEKNGISPETVELAAKLMRKHGEAAYARLEARRKK